MIEIIELLDDEVPHGEQLKRPRRTSFVSACMAMKQVPEMELEAVNPYTTLKKPTKRSCKHQIKSLALPKVEPLDEIAEDIKPLIKRRKSDVGEFMEEKSRRPNLPPYQIAGLPVGAVPADMPRTTLTEEERRRLREDLRQIKFENTLPLKKILELDFSHQYEHEYMVDRIMCKVGRRYLVSWSGWNFTWCSTSSFNDLKNSPLLMKQFAIYEKGIDAIYNTVINTPWYTENIRQRRALFKRKFVHQLKHIEDDELKRLLAGPQNELNSIMGPLKYWKVKRVELEWLKVLNPKLDFNLPPLYLESMLIHEKVPEIEVSDEVMAMLKKGRGNHHCIFGPPEKYCDKCKSMVRLEQNDPKRLNDLTFPEDKMALLDEGAMAYIVVCTSSSNCVCPGGWSKCGKWLPQVPLVVFADPRYDGWGVRALTDIQKGTIISEYCGDVYIWVEAPETDFSYQMGTHGEKFVVDTKHRGNESRFFGHSCSNANLILVRVFCRDAAMEYQYRNCFVTSRHVKAGEDLVFDYHPTSEKPRKGYGRCRMNSVVMSPISPPLEWPLAVVALLGIGSLFCTILHLVQSTMRGIPSDPEPGLLVLTTPPPREGYISYLYQHNEEKSKTFLF